MIYKLMTCVRPQKPNAKQATWAAAAAELDHALELFTNDPAVLQERAEIALLQSDWTGAEHYAKRAVELRFKNRPHSVAATGPQLSKHDWHAVKKKMHPQRTRRLDAAPCQWDRARCR